MSYVSCIGQFFTTSAIGEGHRNSKCCEILRVGPSKIFSLKKKKQQKGDVLFNTHSEKSSVYSFYFGAFLFCYLGLPRSDHLFLSS